jgi:hypothetical protein
VHSDDSGTDGQSKGRSLLPAHDERRAVLREAELDTATAPFSEPIQRPCLTLICGHPIILPDPFGGSFFHIGLGLSHLASHVYGSRFN